MKKNFTLLAITLLTMGGFAQTTVLNPSFENWTDEVVFDSLEHWTTSYQDFIWSDEEPNVWQDDTDPYDGTYSMYLETVLLWNTDDMENDTVFGYIIKENVVDGDFRGFPYVDTVDQFTFWYKCDVATGDSAAAIIQLSKGGTIYAETIHKMYGTVSTWTEAVVSIPDGETDKPDSLWIGFASSDPVNADVATEGSVLEVDLVTLQWTGGSDIPTPIPNNSFENNVIMEVETVDNWTGFNDILYLLTGDNYLVNSSTASSGTAAVQLTVTAANVSEDVPALITSGEFPIGAMAPVGGSPFIAQPDELLFDYQYAPGGVDTAFFWLQIWNDGTGSLVDVQHPISNTVSTWDTDTISLGLTEAPDSIRIVLYAGDVENSEFMVDNIRFEGGDLGTGSMDMFQEWGVFPNPANGVTNIIFQTADQISISNLAGQTVYQETVLNSNKVELNTALWPEGVYMVELSNDSKVETKKLVVSH